ncbi:MAG: DUF6438 domain-containing protein [Bacteroidota bacterium]
MVKPQHLLVILVLFAFGCKSGKQSGTDLQPIFTMEKTVCMGPCPSWLFKLYPNGKVAYAGRENVKLLGNYSAEISKEELSGFRNMLDEAKFFKYANVYSANIKDLPTTYLYYDNGEQFSKITDYYGAPESLKKLEKKIEEFIETIAWKQN